MTTEPITDPLVLAHLSIYTAVVDTTGHSVVLFPNGKWICEHGEEWSAEDVLDDAEGYAVWIAHEGCGIRPDGIETASILSRPRGLWSVLDIEKKEDA